MIVARNVPSPATFGTGSSHREDRAQNAAGCRQFDSRIPPTATYSDNADAGADGRGLVDHREAIARPGERDSCVARVPSAIELTAPTGVRSCPHFS